MENGRKLSLAAIHHSKTMALFSNCWYGLRGKHKTLSRLEYFSVFASAGVIAAPSSSLWLGRYVLLLTGIIITHRQRTLGRMGK
jgi:hypothetical protein